MRTTSIVLKSVIIRRRWLSEKIGERNDLTDEGAESIVQSKTILKMDFYFINCFNLMTPIGTIETLNASQLLLLSVR